MTIERPCQGPATDELVDLHIARLADTESTIGGLVLDRRIPPAVEVNDVVGGRQVEPRAAGLE